MPGQYADCYAGNQVTQTAWGTGTVDSAPVNASQAGDNTLIAAQPGRRIVVLQGDLIASGAVIATMQSQAGKVLDGPCSYAQNGGKIYPQNIHGHFSTDRGEALILHLNQALQVGGHLVYAIV